MPNDFTLVENLVILNSKSILNSLIISLKLFEIFPGKRIRIKVGRLLAMSTMFKGDFKKSNLLGQQINRIKNSNKNQLIIMISITFNDLAKTVISFDDVELDNRIGLSS